MSEDIPSQLHPPDAVVGITRELERAGYDAWCVGGAVRDALLGHAHLDWDLATNATPDQVRGVFGRRRTVPVGIAFGTVGVLDGQNVLHEVTTFRRDVRTDGRHAEVEFGASLDEDLARRDFTVNAIAYSPSRRQLHDPFGGREDLARRVIRAVGEPHERMREDRLRALRGIRFAARLGFAIEAGTWEAIRASAPHLGRLSAERIRQELEKTMDQVARPSVALGQWRESGAFDVVLPELASVTDEVRLAVDCAAQPGLPNRPGRRLVRFATLLSDLNGAAVVQLSTRLRFSRQESMRLAALVERWRAQGGEITDRLASGGVEASQLRRWIAAIGRLDVAPFFRLAAARWAARSRIGAGEGTVPRARAVHQAYRRSLRALLTEPVDLRDLAIDGDDLRAAGIPPGPALGKILSSLLEAVIEDPRLNTREHLLRLARDIADSTA